MKRLLTIFVAMLLAVGMLAVVPVAETEELPEGATPLDYAGYIHDSYFVILAGDDMTVGELTALGIGEEKDMNYFAVAVVDEYDTITEIHLTLGRPDGVKTDVVCPKYGYIIGLNANKAGWEILKSVHVGDIVELINVDVDSFRGATGNIALENAGFIIYDESGETGDVSGDESSEAEDPSADESVVEESSEAPVDESEDESSEEEPVSSETPVSSEAGTETSASATSSAADTADDGGNTGLIVGIVIAVVVVAVIVVVVVVVKKRK